MIEKYEWDQSISTGDPALDIQHKQFFFALYDFAESLERAEGAKKLKKMLVFLKYYGEWHFGKEETSVACFKCPMACENTNAHQQYMDTIDDLLEQIRDSWTSEALAYSSYKKLTDWLVGHIMKIDMTNAKHMKVA